jgi:phenylglyoxylate dehydrogenase epsilon subunit
MTKTEYLIVGSSHAGLAALDAIRLQDREGPLTILTQETCLPYSPTILPYLLSGRTEGSRIFLRSEEALRELKASFTPGAKVVSVRPDKREVALDSGETVQYARLLLATGAAPKLPPVEGLQEVAYHVLRTLEDALRLGSASKEAERVVVLGGGLIGLHAAESLAASGLTVTIVEAMPRLLWGYFDEKAAGLVREAFVNKGIEVLTSEKVHRASKAGRGCVLTLESGRSLPADFLLIATGVQPRMDYLAGSGVETDEGILVDEQMRTNVEHIWAAGDVAQARSFFDGTPSMNAILPSAVEQGSIAGMDMVGDPALKPFVGSIPLNTYKFFGHRAFSVGMVQESDGLEVEKVRLPEARQYLKLVFRGDRLVGAIGINSDLDPGVMHQLIRRKVYLGEAKAKLCANPVETSRVMMTTGWR